MNEEVEDTNWNTQDRNCKTTLKRHQIVRTQTGLQGVNVCGRVTRNGSNVIKLNIKCLDVFFSNCKIRAGFFHHFEMSAFSKERKKGC